jgi:hypothetical protein
VLSFNDYVKEYGLGRAEGVLLRYLTDVYRALRRTVPERDKTDAVLDLEEWLGAEIRQVDASLLAEWERLDEVDAGVDVSGQDATSEVTDVTRNVRALTVMIRNASFRLVLAMARRDASRFASLASELMPLGADGEPLATPYNPRRADEIFDAYYAEHEALLVDAAARSPSRQIIEPGPESYRVRQVLSDPEENHDWALCFEVPLDACRREGRLVMVLTDVESP